MQDPGRLALFDEYLEMSTFQLNDILSALHKVYSYRKLTLFRFTILSAFGVISFAIRICDIICGCISIGAILCIAQ